MVEEASEGIKSLVMVEEGRERSGSVGLVSAGFRMPATTAVMSRKAGPLSSKSRQGSGRNSAASSTCDDVDDAERKADLADLSDAESVGSASRGVKRARPPTTGGHVDSVALPAKRLATECEDHQTQAEVDVAEAARVQRERRAARRAAMRVVKDSGPAAASASGSRPEDKLGGDLAEIARGDIDIILEVAARSSNLKGTFIRSLKEAAASLRTVVEELGCRSVDGEVMRLEAANNRLRAEVADLRQELLSMRESIDSLRGQGTAVLPLAGGGRGSGTLPAPPAAEPAGKGRGQVLGSGSAVAAGLLPGVQSASDLETVVGVILQRVGVMLDARLEAMGDRLPPPQSLRPPLGVKPGGQSVGRPTPAADERGGGRGKRESKGGDGAKTAPGKLPGPFSPSPLPPAPLPLPLPADQAWSEVVGRRRGGQRGAATKPAASSTARPPAAKTGVGKGRGGRGVPVKPGAKAAAKPVRPPPVVGKPKPVLRPPRMAAVTVTAVSGGSVALAEAMAEARSKITLRDLGIETVRIKRAVTGGLILEVPGQDGALRADKLAEKMRAVLANKEVVVSRPLKCAELRVAGLEDSITSKEVTEAVAHAGGCSEGEVSVGEIRRSPSGLGSAWVK